jgi:hypothetical protein
LSAAGHSFCEAISDGAMAFSSVLRIACPLKGRVVPRTNVNALFRHGSSKRRADNQPGGQKMWDRFVRELHRWHLRERDHATPDEVPV